jgi:HEAT repeat protein
MGRIVLQAEPKSNDEREAVYASYLWNKEDLNKISAALKIYGFPSEFGQLDIKDIYSEKTPTQTTGKVTWKPLPGMGYYGGEDADMFKGRNREISDLVSMVCYRPISLLVGETGIGKTSIIHAGLFPHLKTMDWNCIILRPLDDPQKYIKEVLWQTFFQGSLDKNKSLYDVFKDAAQKVKPKKILVVIDQFEEVLSCPKFFDELILALAAVQASTIMPNLKVLVSFREDFRITINDKILNKVAGSSQRFPTLELQGIGKEGAREAIVAILKNIGIGFDPSSYISEKPLIEIILDDLKNKDDLIYPPFLQMILESLFIRVANRNPPLITIQIYQEELKGTNDIIANYLFNQLNEFGDKQETAKKILKTLTSSDGTKAKKKTLDDLSHETEIPLEEVKNVTSMMVESRMLRPLEKKEFELIHDFLGKIIIENLFEDEDRSIKFLQEQLDSFQQAFKVSKVPINQPAFMAMIYRNRRKIRISEEKYPLLLSSSLLYENGSGWFFLKGLERSKLVELLKEQMNHPYSAIRARAIGFFLKIVSPGDRDVLLKLLEDPDSDVRRQAVEALMKIGDRNVLLKLLENQDKELKRQAARALTSIVTPVDRDVLLKLLEDPDSDVRRQAVEALTIVVFPGDRDVLLKLLEDPDSDVRRQAVEALTKIADRDTLLKLLEDQDSSVRWQAIKALIKIGDKKTIFNLLQKQGSLVRWQAIEALLKTGDRDVLFKMLKDKDSVVRLNAAIELTSIVTPVDRDVLLKLLEDPDSDVRRQAVEALTKIGDRNVLLKLLEDQDSVVRLQAARAFKLKASSKDRDVLLNLLENQDSAIRGHAIAALENLALPQDRAVLFKMLEDKEKKVSRQAASALVEIGDKDVLLKLLDYPDSDIKTQAIEALRKINEQETLLKLVNNPDSDIKVQAINALVGIGHRETILKLLDNQDSNIRWQTRRALKSTVFSQGKDVLLKLLEDQDSVIRALAAKALARVILPCDRDLLFKLLEDQDSEVRRQATGALINLCQRSSDEEVATILDHLADYAQGWRKEQKFYLQALTEIDQSLFSPTNRQEDKSGNNI